MAQLQGKVDSEIIKRLSTQIVTLKKLHDHKLQMDAGMSYKAFWAKGTQVFEALRGISNDTKKVPKPTTGDLDDRQARILQLLAEMENRGRECASETDIFRTIDISASVVKYHLGELLNKKYVRITQDMNSPLMYWLNHQGREYLIKNNLI